MRYILRRPLAFWISIVNLAGLVFSVWGVLLLFYNVLPTPIPGEGTGIAADDYNSSLWRAERDRHDRDAHRGLVLVLAAAPDFWTAG
jgi:hypothetical protein